MHAILHLFIMEGMIKFIPLLFTYNNKWGRKFHFW